MQYITGLHGGRRGGYNQHTTNDDDAQTQANPLCHTNPALRTRIAAFQSSPLAASPPICGLDPSIIIEPIRFHLTLAVMALAEDPEPIEQTVSPATHTVSTALALLRSLKPRLDAILDTDGGEHADHAGLQVVLDALDIMRPVPPPGASEDVWAKVMYLAPREMGAEGVKLRRIADADCVERAFKEEGYVTEMRPLKLHCTILNTSKRRPARARARGQPFCYSDILPALTPATTPTAHLPVPVPVAAPAPAPAPASTTLTTAPTTTTTKALPPPPPPVSLARALAPFSIPASATETPVLVHELGLWNMGSRAPDGAYVSCGGVSLGGSVA
ncbi:hypothetical protein D9615_009938 [Tricholomella constricta]|uniref:A-kinase anchor protein 7-like phosphoesterase domain-containing protein n=1 Tax=Tricholomella constricta TaxID=117010 RepID=A0A8H5LY90_9AGAR|nr:hypothetical protein D9615_009938 [Tricholomella constricta]